MQNHRAGRAQGRSQQRQLLPKTNLFLNQEFDRGAGQVRRLVAATILLGVSPLCATAQSYFWNRSTGTFSSGINWQGGSPPPAGGGSTLSLIFNGSASGAAYTATNDAGAPFLVNSLLFGTVSSGTSGPINVTSSGSGSLRFTGTAPTITQNSHTNAVTLTGYLDLAPTSGTTTVGGSGLANLTIAGAISGSGGLTINQTGTTEFGYGGSIVTLNTQGVTNTFTGGVTLQNGNLALQNTGSSTGSSTVLGNASNVLTIAAGGKSSLRFATNGLTILNNIAAEGDLNLTGSQSGYLGGMISGAGGLNVSFTNGSTLTLERPSGAPANSYTGATTIGSVGALETTNAPGPTLLLNGNGTISGTASVTVNNNATMAINTGVYFAGNRVPDTAPVFLNSGQISYTGFSGYATNETWGAVTATGLGKITVSSATTALNFGSLTRTDNATLFFRGAIGGGPAGSSISTVKFSGGLGGISDPLNFAGGQNTPIIPFASASTVATSSFLNAMVTYDANGIRILPVTNATYFAQIASGGALAPHLNNHLTASPAAINSAVRVNALAVSGATLSGTGTLQVNSGAVMNSGSLILNGPTLDFGANTGYFHIGAPVTVQGTSSITGSAGVVASDFGPFSGYALNLKNTGVAGNPFSGGLFINGGAVVAFNAPNGNDLQLGAAGQGITLAGGTLDYTGSGSVTINASRPFTINDSSGTIRVSTFGGALTYGGAITGTGSLFYSGPGTLALSGSNTYSGDTFVRQGTLNLTGTTTNTGSMVVSNAGMVQASSGDALGSGAIVLSGFGTFQPTANGVFGQNIVSQGTTQNTLRVGAGVSATLSGVLSGTQQLRKDGAGTIILTGANTLAASFFGVEEGMLTVTGVSGSVNEVQSLYAISDGVLRLDNSAGINTDRIGANTEVTVYTGGELRLDGAAGTATNESFGRLRLNAGGAFITIAPGAGAGASLTATNFSFGSYVVFRGPNIGTAGGAQFFVSSGLYGLIPNALVDDSLTGLGKDIAFIDSISGVRFPQISDFKSGLVLQNAAPTNTSTAEWFRVSGAGGQTVDASNQVSVLRIAPDATLDASSGTLTISSGIITAERGGSGGTRLSGGILTSGATQMRVVNIDPLLIESNLSGTGGFSKTGTGALTLTGNYGVVGNLVVNAGTLTLPSGAGASATSVYSGATLNSVGDYNAGASLGMYSGAQGESVTNIAGNLGVGQISLQSNTTISVGGNINANTNIFFNGGTIQTNGGNITNTGALTLNGVGNVINTNGGNLTTGDVNGSNTLIDLGATGALTINQTATDGVARRFEGTITGGSSFTKNGTANLLLTLTAPMTYTGATNLNNGQLIWGADHILPASTTLTIAPNASFNLNGFDQTIAGINYTSGGRNSSFNNSGTGVLTLAGDLVTGPAGSGGGVFSISGTGGVDLAGEVRNFTIAGNGTGTTYDVRFSGPIRNGGINYTGTPGTSTGSPPAVLSLGGQNTYTGGTFINQGTLRAESQGALPSAGVVTFGTANSGTGGTLDLRSTDQQTGGAVHTVAGITIAPGNTAGDANRIINSGRTAATLEVNNTSDFTWSGAIAPETTANLSVIKSGSAMLTLSGTGNTYTGATTVNDGELNITGSLAAGSAVTVNDGGTLSGSGVVGAITLNTGGVVAGGDLSGFAPVGDGLSATSLLFNPGGELVFRLGANSSVSDNLTFSSALLMGTTGTGEYLVGFSDRGIDLSQGPVLYNLVTYDDTVAGSDFAASSFTARGSGNLSGVDGNFVIANPGTSGAVLQYVLNGTSISAVPEPGSIAFFLLGAGGIALVGTRRFPFGAVRNK